MNQFRTDSLIKFENNISDKSFAYDNIRITCRNISCLNASDKIDPFCFFEKRKSFLNQSISLFFLCTVIYNRNTRVFDADYMFHINRSHFCKLYQMRWSGVNICATVNQKRNSFSCWNQRSQRRTFHTFASADKNLTADKDRTRASRRNKCIGLLFFYHFKSYND